MSDRLPRLLLVVTLAQAVTQAAAAEPDPHDSLEGRPAALTTLTGQRFDGKLVCLTPKAVVLSTGSPPADLSWPASQIKSLEIGDNVYVYGGKSQTLQPRGGADRGDGAGRSADGSGNGETPTDAVVVVTGVGLDRSAATKDALVSAVRHVVGEVVDAKTLVRNDKLVIDEVLTYSNGFVAAYEEVARWEVGREVHVRVRATVQRERIMDKLRGSGVPLQDFDGSKTYARVVTELQQAKDARKMLRRKFERFPDSLIDARVVTEPRPLERSEDEVTLGYDVAFGIDSDKYESFLRDTIPLLDLMASRKGTFTLYGRPAPAAVQSLRESYLPKELTLSKSCLDRIPVPLQIDMRSYRETWWTDDLDHKTQMVVLVNTARSKDHRVTTWAWYHLPEAELAPSKLRLEVRFLGAGRRDVVAADGFPLGSMPTGGQIYPGLVQEKRTILHPKTRNATEVTQIIVSPYLVFGSRYGSSMVVDRTVKVPLEKLNLAKHIQTKIIAGESDDPAGDRVESSPASLPKEKSRQQTMALTPPESELRGKPDSLSSEGQPTRWPASPPVDAPKKLSTPNSNPSAPMPERTAKDRERHSKLILRAAREKLSDGYRREALDILEEVVRKFPDTAAAGEARELWERLNRD
jgi:hypothetical protein